MRDSYQKSWGRVKNPHSWCVLVLKGRTVPSITLQQHGAQLLKQVILE